MSQLLPEPLGCSAGFCDKVRAPLQPRRRHRDRLRPEVARALVVRRGIYRPDVDAVRYTTVGDLTNAGFDVVRDPTPCHPRPRPCPGRWDDDVAERFESCFGPVPEEET